jgi:hypothetical protein
LSPPTTRRVTVEVFDPAASNCSVAVQTRLTVVGDFPIGGGSFLGNGLLSVAVYICNCHLGDRYWKRNRCVAMAP